MTAKIKLSELEEKAATLKRIYAEKATAQFMELEVHADVVERLCRALREAEDALRYYAENPAYKESSYLAIRSDFRSGNHAQRIRDKIRQEVSFE